MRMWWVWIFPVIGVGLLLGSVFAWLKARQFIATASRAVGEVVEFHEYDSTNDDGRTTRMYDPIIRFTAPDGSVIEKNTGVGSSQREYKLGQRVRLLYDPAKPADFKLDNVMHLYMAPGILAFIGIIFTIVGTICVLAFASPKTELVDTPPELLREDTD